MRSEVIFLVVSGLFQPLSLTWADTLRETPMEEVPEVPLEPTLPVAPPEATPEDTRPTVPTWPDPDDEEPE